MPKSRRPDGLTTATLRTSIHLRPVIKALLLGGRIRGASVSARLDRMAERYIWIMEEAEQRIRPMIAAAEWLAILDALDEVRHDQPQRKDDMAAIIRQRARAGQVAQGADLRALSSRIDVMRWVDQIAVLDMAERMLHAGIERSVDAIQVWLNSK